MPDDTTTPAGSSGLPDWVGEINDLFLGWWDRTHPTTQAGVGVTTGPRSTQVNISTPILVGAVLVVAVLLIK